MNHNLGLTRILTAVALASCFAYPLSAAKDRVSGQIDGRQTVLVKGSVHPLTSPESDRGAVSPSRVISEITINIKLSANQQSDLNHLLESQRDPSAPEYQKWLTPEEFGSQFGLSLADMNKLTTWLQSHGFSVDHVSQSMNWVSFSGTAEQVDRVFRTEIHTFLVDGQSHFANTRMPAIPAALSNVISNIQGLNDFKLKPLRLPANTVSPNFTTAGGTHYLAPGDLAKVFNISALYTAGFDGTGQKLVVAGQTDVNLSDVAAFRSQFGLSANVPQLVLYGTDPGTTADLQEAHLDLEWTGAVARNATIIYVYSTNVLNSVQYAISNNLAPVISLSYGGCEALNSSSLQSVAQQANAQGITWIASSGDSGAAGCDSGAAASGGLAVDMPASIPEVTAVGGSEFNEGTGNYWGTTNSSTGGSALSYIPEIAWNDSFARGSLAATGGGASMYYLKPTWQTGPGVPADGKRDVPDVSLPASPDHDGFYFYSGGALQVVGGTSVSAPAFAGIVTVLNQYLLSKGVISTSGLGNINPNLYHLASGANSIFHDITSGNNNVPCVAASTGCNAGILTGYSAGPGYDQVTGLGSVNAYNLVTQWTGVVSSIGTTSTSAANPASIPNTSSTTVTATITPVTGTTAPTGSVTFSLGTQTLGTVTLVAGSGVSTATLSVSGASLVSGNNTITAAYGGSSAFTSSSSSTVVTVTASTVTTTTTSLSASPASIASSASTKLTALVKATTGTVTPTGTVTFSLGTKNLGTGTLAKGSASLTVSGISFAGGSNTVTASFSGSSSFGTSSGTAAVTVNLATTMNVTASPVSIANTASTTLTATVSPSSGTAAPSGTVTFTLGTKTLGTAPLSASGSSGLATLTVSGSSLATGSNTITATYGGSTGFTTSNSTTAVTVTGAAVTTTTAVTASPISFSRTASTKLTATVTPASGNAAPTGTITFTFGTLTLGTATLSGAGSTATASLTVKGASFTVGSDTVTASYAGSNGFGSSSGTVILTVTK
jgi:hypothetical protein